MRKLLKITTTFVVALIFTAGMAFGQNNTADVDQSGDNLKGIVTQSGQANTATLKQNGGADNVANIDQKGTGNESTVLQPHQQGQFGGDAPYGVTALVKQDGQSNVSYIQQANTSNDLADQNQGGSGHEARISQAANWNAFTKAEQDQFGSGQYARIRQAFSPGAEVVQLQLGSDNSADSYQVNSDGASVDIFQDGSDLQIDTEQRDADGSSIESSQEGSLHGAEILQGKGFVSNGEDLTAILDQSGTGHHATIKQSNVGHTANVMQSGQGNQATVTQQ